MFPDKVADFSVDDLRQFVDQAIDTKLAETIRPLSDTALDDLLAKIEATLLTLPLGAKSSLEYIREDRDR
ncbi:MAG: hypothetical protein ACOYL5_15680 [Phototrophicaceae bacterium]